MPAHHDAFCTTHWTQVLAARGKSEASQVALSDLCGAYYEPVFLFLRSEGRPAEAARELAHEFFARLLHKPGLEYLDPARGRFRSFLLGSLKHFLADVRDREQAAKRGGGVTPDSFDSIENDTSVSTAPASAPRGDVYFDRQWALTLMAQSLAILEEEFKLEGRTEHFIVLKPWLVGEAAILSQADAARALDLSEGAVKVAVHRFRRRFREIVRAAISPTVNEESEVDEELRYLIEVLAQRAT
ncbi:MAG: hypothetical protein QOF48_881 [Verrucomicrobiota bacterium]|jgi:RNA polymerase sigma-70 factor (ECF subfamily)